MEDVIKLLKNKKANFEKLLRYGFIKEDTQYVYQTYIMKQQFKLIIIVSLDYRVETKLFDMDTDELYVLHQVNHAKGNYIAAIREEYLQILTSIVSECFENNVFKSKQAQEIIHYIKAKYHNELLFLWKNSDNAVFKRSDNKKWYAVLLIVQKCKIGLDGDEPIEIIDLRVDPEEVSTLVDKQKYFPGYHMNKKHWITICLDNTLTNEEIQKRIDESYKIAKK